MIPYKVSGGAFSQSPNARTENLKCQRNTNHESTKIGKHEEKHQDYSFVL